MRPAFAPTVWNCLPRKRDDPFSFCPYLSPTVMNDSVEKVLVNLQRAHKHDEEGKIWRGGRRRCTVRRAERLHRHARRRRRARTCSGRL